MRIVSLKTAFFVMACLVSGCLVSSDGAEERVDVTTVASGLSHPWGLAFLADGRMLVTERGGTLRIVDSNGRISSPVSGVPKVFAEGQGGLLDIVLDPAFTTNSTIYMSFSDVDATGSGTAVMRAVLKDSSLERQEVIFRQRPYTGTTIHFGSRLVFGRDGKLFVTLGERGERDYAQDLKSYRGKILRIGTDGSAPSDNPFVDRKDARPEIWSYGHRNVQGAALHPVTGELWTHEHGPQGGDEVNIARAANNYGWPVVTYGEEYGGGKIGEGAVKDGIVNPLHYWIPSIAPCGMAFYTGSRFPAWKGNLFVASLKFGYFVRLEVDGEKVTKVTKLVPSEQARFRNVVMGPAEFLYALTDSDDGKVLKLQPAS